MFPLKDTVPHRTFPLMTLFIIVVNGLVFFFELSMPENYQNAFIALFGLVPARYSHPLWAQVAGFPLDSYWPFFTNMFLHGGWLHIIGNMWMLYLFGDNVEDRMGSGRYFIFYTLSGLASGLLQSLIAPASRVPAIGASGAIAGVLGAYFILYPAGRVLTLIPIFIIPWFVEIPAIVFLGFWFVSQLFSGLAALNVPNAANMGGVAWWAHIGGFLFGILAHRLFIRNIHPAYYRDYPRFPDNTI